MNWRVLMVAIFWACLGILFLGMGFFYYNLSKKGIKEVVFDLKVDERMMFEPNWYYTKLYIHEINREVNRFIHDFNEASQQQNQKAAYASFGSSAAAFLSMFLAWRDLFHNVVTSIRERRNSRRRFAKRGKK